MKLKSRQIGKSPTICFLVAISSLVLLAQFELCAQNENRPFGFGWKSEFERITTQDGLSQNSVNCILQDSRGFIWFGTQDGLNRFDGYDFKVYKHQPGNPRSLSNNQVTVVFEDRSGVLWIGTIGGGLNRFDFEKETFRRYENEPVNLRSLSNNHVRAIHEDENGRLWIGTHGGGLNKFDRQLEAFTHYNEVTNNPGGLSLNHVMAICKSGPGRLWIGTTLAGLLEFDIDKETFAQHRNDPNNPNSLSHNDVMALHEDQSGNLWIGTFGGGLNRLVARGSAEDNASPIFVRYNHEPGDPNSLSNDRIRAIYEEPGELWVGTEGGGLNRFDLQSQTFARYIKEDNDERSLSNNRVMSLYGDQSGTLWIATYGGGVNKLNQNRKKFVHYKHDPTDPNSLSDYSVRSILEDRSGVLWVGTWLGGLNRISRSGKGAFPIFDHFEHDPEDPRSLSHNSVLALLEDRTGDLWIGTDDGLSRLIQNDGAGRPLFINYRHDPNRTNSVSGNHVVALHEDRAGQLWVGTDGQGLNRFDPSVRNGSLSFIHYKYQPDNPKSLSSNRVRVIYQDRSGLLWIGTLGRGLNRFDQRTDTFTWFRNQPGNHGSLSNNEVWSILEDRSGTVWVGTAGGLNKLDRTTQSFTRYTERDGLPNDVIYGILEDHTGNLWVSTNKGLSRFDPESETFRNYDARDGLQNNEFNGTAHHKSRSGELFFGGIGGLNRFYPDDIVDNPHVPRVAITDFKIFNESVGIEGTEGKKHAYSLPKGISETDEIVLSDRDDIFSFAFAALDFTDPARNQYAYKMEGFNDDWIHAGNKREATYTNLDPGEYLFRVKASNNDGVWNETGTSIRIIITPPFWQTWWFRLLVILSFLTSALSWHKRRLTRIEAKRKALEIQVREKSEAAQALQNALSEVESLKNRLHAENVYLQDEIKLEHNFADIIGRSKALKEVLHKVEQVASSYATVLVLGQSGTGKELLARAVHNLSPRRERPLVKVNCAALPANLIESELFGHEKGAFTGALARKVGRFELADGGTVFLDEIGELPLELQTKLLRVLQEGEIERLGSAKTLKVDVRVIAATNRDLEKEIRHGRFREDLFYRLNVFPIKSPPLAERREDIPLLVNHFVKKYSTKVGKKIESVSQNVLETLQNYPWPGNVRELENIVERAVIVSRGKQLKLDDWLPSSDSITRSDGIGKPFSSLEQNEREHILMALKITNWRVSGDKGAAKILGINAKTLQSRIKKLGIQRA